MNLPPFDFLGLDRLRVLVLGLGETGHAIARFVAAQGAVVRVADTRARPPALDRLASTLAADRLAPAEFIGGPFSPGLLDGVALVVASPGLSPAHAPLRELIGAARSRDLEVIGEIELFARALARLRAARGYAPRLLGITGTNGKTTTARMLTAMVERSGRSVLAAGNISPSALQALHAALAHNQLPQVWVLELSSFQLATCSTLACDAAALLNLTEDHLDWHATLADYTAAKARIFAPGTIQVLNRDQPAVLALAGEQGRARVVTFGESEPQAPRHGAAFGLVTDPDGALDWLALAEDLDEPARLSTRRRAAAEDRHQDQRQDQHQDQHKRPGEPWLQGRWVQRLMPTAALRIPGRHNALNALAALALGRAIGCPLAPMLHALRDYRGEPHRVERVALVDGVTYYDDSKGTNVGATVAAISGLGLGAGAGPGPGARRLVLILGGDGKGQDFAPLVAPLQRHARAAVLIGRDRPRLEAALAISGVPLLAADTLPDAVRAAAAQALPGDAVLLSPACASLDMFRDYRHRAEVYVAAVNELAELATLTTERAPAVPTEPGLAC